MTENAIKCNDIQFMTENSNLTTNALKPSTTGRPNKYSYYVIFYDLAAQNSHLLGNTFQKFKQLYKFNLHESKNSSSDERMAYIIPSKMDTEPTLSSIYYYYNHKLASKNQPTYTDYLTI